jgi:molybdopterin converting factor small subunit
VDIQVRALGILKALITEPCISLEEGGSLAQLLNLLMQRYGKPLQEIALDPETNQIHSFICILLNGKIVGGLDERLERGDEVTLFIPVSGGSPWSCSTRREEKWKR